MYHFILVECIGYLPFLTIQLIVLPLLYFFAFVIFCFGVCVAICENAFCLVAYRTLCVEPVAPNFFVVAKYFYQLNLTLLTYVGYGAGYCLPIVHEDRIRLKNNAYCTLDDYKLPHNFLNGTIACYDNRTNPFVFITIDLTIYFAIFVFSFILYKKYKCLH
jgi:hypothetical protein